MSEWDECGEEEPVRTRGTGRSWIRGVALTAGMILGLESGVLAEPWPGWRGTGDGVVTGGLALPRYWDAHRNRAWRIPLPRPGSGSPVVWEDRVLLVQPDRHSTAVMCFRRRDGSLDWRMDMTRIRPAATRAPFGTMEAPSRGGATPVTDGHRVVALMGSVVWCLDMEGKDLWERQLENRDPSVGLPASPVLAGGLCLVALQDPERVEALDLATGETRWTVPLQRRLRTLTVQDGAVLAADGGWLRALEVATGRERWKEAVGDTPSRHGVVGLPGALLMPTRSPGAVLWEPRGADVSLGGGGWLRRWENPGIGSVCSAAVASDEFVFLVDDAGDVLCLDRRDGRERGRRRLRESMSVSGSWTSPILASGHLYLVNESGDVVVLGADAKLDLKAVNRLGEGLSSSPAAADGSLYLRTDLALWCLREGATGTD